MTIDDYVYNNLGEIYTSSTKKKTACFDIEDDAQEFFRFLGNHDECYSRCNVRMDNRRFLVDFEVH